MTLQQERRCEFFKQKNGKYVRVYKTAIVKKASLLLILGIFEILQIGKLITF